MKILSGILDNFIYMQGGILSTDRVEKKIESFWISNQQVNQKLWVEIMGYNPSSRKGDDLPVDKVSWYECQEFIKKYSEKANISFRMPTNDEWEYAAKKGLNGEIGEWTVSPHCFRNNNGYGKYSVTRFVGDIMEKRVTRVLTIKERGLGFRLALDDDEFKRINPIK